MTPVIKTETTFGIIILTLFNVLAIHIVKKKDFSYRVQVRKEIASI